MYRKWRKYHYETFVLNIRKCWRITEYLFGDWIREHFQMYTAKTIIAPWPSNFSSWHWSYLTVLRSHSGKQELMLLGASPSATAKVLVTLSWAHAHTEWKSKAIPPWIKLCRWSNGLSWWQGTIISSKEVRAADWRMKNIVRSGGWEMPRQTAEHSETGFGLAFMINWCLFLPFLLLGFLVSSLGILSAE